jgi:hypothetical protein
LLSRGEAGRRFGHARNGGRFPTERRVRRMTDSFTVKYLSFSFSLAQGNFQGGGNSATVMTAPGDNAGNLGLRASVHIVEPTGQLEATIYGLPLSLMNQLTTLPGILNTVANNKITVQAGDASGMQVAFTGDIFTAYMDGSAQPHVPFRVSANSAILSRIKPTPPTSVAGSADVATIMGQLASTMGLQFENNNVSVKIANLYLHGAAKVQVEQLAKMAGIQHIVSKGKLAIWNSGQSRSGSPVLVSKDTGMVGYPSFSSACIIVKSLFNPSLESGGQITVQSDITAACGTWTIISLVYDLESFMPRGKWFQTMTATKSGQQVKTSGQ